MSAQTSRDGPVFRLSLLCYAGFLRTYPRRFRLEWGGQMLSNFESDLRRAAAGRGIRGIAAVWRHTILDYIRTVIAEHVVRSSTGSRGPRRGPSGEPPHGRTQMIEELWQDIRFTFRTMRKAPGFAAIAVVILALGIGANTTIFTVVSTLFLNEPPNVQSPGDLVRINRVSRASSVGALAYPDYVHFRDNNSTLENVLAYDSDLKALTAEYNGARTPITGGFVSGEYFATLGVVQALGRTFRSDDDLVSDPTFGAVVSHRFWQRTLGGDSAAVGRTLSLNGHPFTVLGVTPRGFRGLSPTESPPDVWLPLSTAPLLTTVPAPLLFDRVQGETNRWIWTIARLRPGVSVEQANADVAAMGVYLAQAFPQWNSEQGANVTPNALHGSHRAPLVRITRLLSVVAGIVLLIASANIAILLLARASVRRRELGVRTALGAQRSRLIRQLLVESLVLSGFGGTIGFGLAYATADVLATLMPLPFAVDFTPNLAVLGFAIAVSAMTAVLFGTTPAVRATRDHVSEVITGTVSSESRSSFRNALVVGQVTLAVVLVVGASLFASSLRNARSLDLGFASSNRLLAAVNLRSHGYDAERTRTFTRQAIERLGALPGVQSVTTTRMRPFRGQWGSTFVPEGGTGPTPEGAIDAGFNAVGPGYFATMEIPILRGREFTDADDMTGLRVVVVNETLADQLWPGEPGLGKTLVRGEIPLTVVGVAKTATYYDIGEDPQRQVYLPTLQMDNAHARYFLVHSAGPAMGLARAVQEALNDIEPQLALSEVITLDAVFAGEISQYRVTATFVSVFGALALVLATVGLYGVLSYLVARRSRDIGIQVALGATRNRIAGGIVRHGMTLATGGIVLGLAAAITSSRVVESFLFGIRPRDPITLVGVPLILLVAAMVASLAPAIRATRVDPIRLLKIE